MGAEKKRNKPKKGKYTNPRTGEFRHTDGDRRRRGGPDVNQAIRDKKIRQTFDGGVPDNEPPSYG